MAEEKDANEKKDNNLNDSFGLFSGFENQFLDSRFKETKYSLTSEDLKKSLGSATFQPVYQLLTDKDAIFRIAQLKEPFLGLTKVLQIALSNCKGAASYHDNIWAKIFAKMLYKGKDVSELTMAIVKKNLIILAVEFEIASACRLLHQKSDISKETNNQSITAQEVDSVLSQMFINLKATNSLPADYSPDLKFISELVFAQVGNIKSVSVIPATQLENTYVVDLSNSMNSFTANPYEGTSTLKTVVNLYLKTATVLEELPVMETTGPKMDENNDDTLTRMIEALADYKIIELVYLMISNPQIPFSYLNNDNLDAARGGDEHRLRARQLSNLSQLFHCLTLIQLSGELQILEYAYSYIKENFSDMIVEENVSDTVIAQLLADIKPYTVFDLDILIHFKSVYLDEKKEQNPYKIDWTCLFPAFISYLLPKFNLMKAVTHGNIFINVNPYLVNMTHDINDALESELFNKMISKVDTYELNNRIRYDSITKLPILITNLKQTYLTRLSNLFISLKKTNVLTTDIHYAKSMMEMMKQYIICPSIKKYYFVDGLTRGNLVSEDRHEILISANRYASPIKQESYLNKTFRKFRNLVHTRGSHFNFIVTPFVINKIHAADLQSIMPFKNSIFPHPKSFHLNDTDEKFESFKNYFLRFRDIANPPFTNFTTMVRDASRFFSKVTRMNKISLLDPEAASAFAYALSPLGLCFYYDSTKHGVINIHGTGQTYGEQLKKFLAACRDFVFKPGPLHSIDNPVANEDIIKFKGFSYGLDYNELWQWLQHGQSFETTSKRIVTALSMNSKKIEHLAQMWFGVLPLHMVNDAGKIIVFIPYPVVPSFPVKRNRRRAVRLGLKTIHVSRGINISSFNAIYDIAAASSFEITNIQNNKYFFLRDLNYTNSVHELPLQPSVVQRGEDNAIQDINKLEGIVDPAIIPGYPTFFSRNIIFKMNEITLSFAHAGIHAVNSPVNKTGLSIIPSYVDITKMLTHIPGDELIILSNGADLSVTDRGANASSTASAVEEIINDMMQDEQKKAEKALDVKEQANLKATAEAELLAKLKAEEDANAANLAAEAEKQLLMNEQSKKAAALDALAHKNAAIDADKKRILKTKE